MRKKHARAERKEDSAWEAMPGVTGGTRRRKGSGWEYRLPDGTTGTYPRNFKVLSGSAHGDLNPHVAHWVFHNDRHAKAALFEAYAALTPREREALEGDLAETFHREHGADQVTMYRSLRAGDDPNRMGGMSMTPALASRHGNVHAFRVHRNDVLVHYGQEESSLNSKTYAHEKEVILKPDAHPEYLGPVTAHSKARKARGAHKGAGHDQTWENATVEHRKHRDEYSGWLRAAALKLTHSGLPLQHLIGRGSYGQVHSIVGQPQWVVKITNDEADAAAWQRILEAGGHPGVAKVRSVFVFPQTLPSRDGPVTTPPDHHLFGIVFQKMDEIPQMSDRDAISRTFRYEFDRGPKGRIEQYRRGQHKNLLLAERLQGILQTLEGLKALDIEIHDVRGANVMQDTHGEWKLVDLGISEAPEVMIPELHEVDLPSLFSDHAAARSISGATPGSGRLNTLYHVMGKELQGDRDARGKVLQTVARRLEAAPYNLKIGPKVGGLSGGCGSFGCVFTLKDHPKWVLKVTSDPTDAAAWKHVLDNGALANVPALRVVFAFPVDLPETKGTQLFGIVMEKLGALPLGIVDIEHQIDRTFNREQSDERIREDIDKIKRYDRVLAENMEELHSTVLELQSIGVNCHDIRGANVLADPQGKWRIIDLGMSESPPAEIPELHEVDFARLFPRQGSHAKASREDSARVLLDWVEEHDGARYDPYAKPDRFESKAWGKRLEGWTRRVAELCGSPDPTVRALALDAWQEMPQGPIMLEFCPHTTMRHCLDMARDCLQLAIDLIPERRMNEYTRIVAPLVLQLEGWDPDTHWDTEEYGNLFRQIEALDRAPPMCPEVTFVGKLVQHAGPVIFQWEEEDSYSKVPRGNHWLSVMFLLYAAQGFLDVEGRDRSLEAHAAGVAAELQRLRQCAQIVAKHIPNPTQPPALVHVKAQKVWGAPPGAGKEGAYDDLINKGGRAYFANESERNLDAAQGLLTERYGLSFGEILGEGYFARVLPLKGVRDRVLKISGDPSDAAACAAVNNAGGVPGVARIFGVFAFPQVLGSARIPEGKQLYGIVVERLRPTDASETAHGDELARLPPEKRAAYVEEIRTGEVPPSEFDLELLADGFKPAWLQKEARPELAAKLEGLRLALDDLHGLGIVVHDIRWSNIMQNAAGEWKLSDLGVSESPSVQIPELHEVDMARILRGP